MAVSFPLVARPVYYSELLLRFMYVMMYTQNAALDCQQ